MLFFIGINRNFPVPFRNSRDFRIDCGAVFSRFLSAIVCGADIIDSFADSRDSYRLSIAVPILSISIGDSRDSYRFSKRFSPMQYCLLKITRFFEKCLQHCHFFVYFNTFFSDFNTISRPGGHAERQRENTPSMQI